MTATIDLEKAEGVYFRGPSLAEKIHVMIPGGYTATEVAGEYGPKWYNTNYPLSGIQVVSKTPVHFAVTLVELAHKTVHVAPLVERPTEIPEAEPKAGQDTSTFELIPSVTATDDGQLKYITLKLAKLVDGPNEIFVRISQDGIIERSLNFAK